MLTLQWPMGQRQRRSEKVEEQAAAAWPVLGVDRCRSFPADTGEQRPCAAHVAETCAPLSPSLSYDLGSRRQPLRRAKGHTSYACTKRVVVVRETHACSPHGPLPWPFGATKGHANSLDGISAWNPQQLRIKITFLAAVPLVATDFFSVLEEEGLNINSSHVWLSCCEERERRLVLLDVNL